MRIRVAKDKIINKYPEARDIFSYEDHYLVDRVYDNGVLNIKVYDAAGIAHMYELEKEDYIMEDSLVFEVGKFYRHPSGHGLFIIGRASTIVFGDTLIAEQNNNSSFIAVGSDEENAINFVEITREEWLKNYNIKKENCSHEATIFYHCVQCGEKIFETETRPCGDCYDCMSNGEGSYGCWKKRMDVTKDNHVLYKVKEGTCFRGIKDIIGSEEE
jgi:hypothetical protein